MLLTQRTAKLWHNNCWSGAQKLLHTRWSSADLWKGQTNPLHERCMEGSTWGSVHCANESVQCAYYSIIKYVWKSASHVSCKWGQKTHVLSTLVPLLRLLRGYSSKQTNTPAALSPLRIHTYKIYIEHSVDTLSFVTLIADTRKWHKNLNIHSTFWERKAPLNFQRIHAKWCKLPASELTGHSNYTSSQINWWRDRDTSLYLQTAKKIHFRNISGVY